MLWYQVRMNKLSEKNHEVWELHLCLIFGLVSWLTPGLYRTRKMYDKSTVSERQAAKASFSKQPLCQIGIFCCKHRHCSDRKRLRPQDFVWSYVFDICHIKRFVSSRSHTQSYYSYFSDSDSVSHTIHVTCILYHLTKLSWCQYNKWEDWNNLIQINQITIES